MTVSEYSNGEINYYILLYFVIDTCGGMVGERIATLNYTIKSMIPDIVEMSEEHGVSTYIKVMGYGSNAYWTDENPVEASEFKWKDLSASGLVEMGRAFKLLASDFERIKAHGKNFHPVIVWFSYRQPTDNYIVGLRKLMEQKWFRRTVRIAVTLGDDTANEVLKQFTGNPETILSVKDTRYILKMIRPYDDDCAFNPSDYDYVSTFWELYSKKKSGSVLESIISDYPYVWEDAKRMKALLLDYLPEDKLMRNLILSSVEEQIPHDLYLMKSCSKSDYHKFVKRLTDSHGCMDTKAEEIIKLWLEALDVSFIHNEYKVNDKEEILQLRISDFDISERELDYFNQNNIFTVRDLIALCESSRAIPMRFFNTVQEVIEQLRNIGWTGNILIEEMDIKSERTYFSIKQAGICNVNDLMILSKDDILNIRNLGRKGYEDIENALIKIGKMIIR